METQTQSLTLPNKHHVTDLIICHYHQVGHVGATQVLAGIRTPFTSVGIDYFGPLPVKLKRSRVKRYGCIFTCLTMRAIHIEESQDLSTYSFLLAFTRCVSRHGAPTEIYSDNGTNFRGAECEVRRALETWNETRITESMRRRDVQWYFNPTHASHRGGVWERMIQSVRKILRALLGTQIVNEETLLTIKTEVVKILNDRPLTKLSEDPKELEALTPNHLCCLTVITALPLEAFLPLLQTGSIFK